VFKSQFEQTMNDYGREKDEEGNEQHNVMKGIAHLTKSIMSSYLSSEEEITRDESEESSKSSQPREYAENSFFQ
jgi:hypothetical protein